MNMKDLAKKYNLTKDDYWKESRSGKYIITHDACEKIADMESISFGPPQILNSEQNFCRMVITAKKGEVVIWTIGEADSKNCKNLYIGSMSEKRGKDRAILKLINAYEYGIYSDVEADDFKKPAEEYRTEEQAKEFDNLIKHKSFDGKRNKVKDQIRKDSNQPNYQRVLNKMKTTIQKFENKEAEDINQDLDNEMKEKINAK